jgi:hypothetical protein
MNANDVRAAAVEWFGQHTPVAGADFDGNNLAVLRDGKWTILHRDMCRGLERFITSSHRGVGHVDHATWLE